jgi:guanylate kinase
MLAPADLLFVVSGPSGAGKRTVLKHVTRTFPEIEQVTTYTTREPRPDEHDGVDYRFVTPERFEALVREGEITEWTNPYGDYVYGSPRSLVVNDGHARIVELDYKGMLRLRAATHRRLVSLFILPPHETVVLDRIEARHRESNLRSRLGVAAEQLQFAWAYDYAIRNERLDDFLEAVSTVVRAELVRQAGQRELFGDPEGYDALPPTA